MKTKQILKHLQKVKTIDDSHLAYHPNKYPFTRKEFCALFSALENVVEDVSSYKVTGHFEEYRIPFYYKDVQFVWRLLIGQGSALQLHIRNRSRRFSKWYDVSKAIELTDAMIENGHRDNIEFVRGA